MNNPVPGARRVGAVIAALTLAGCAAAPRTVVEEKPARCELPAIAVEPVPAEPKLTVGATNEDLWNRAQRLEAALDKCNARLVDVPSALKSIPEQPKPAPSAWERFRSLF